MSDVSLVNADGVTVFQGTQVGGGGSLPVTGSGSGSVGDVVGVVYNEPGVYVVGGEDKDTPLNGTGAALTDAFAQWNGNGAALLWSGNGTDGQQSLLVSNDAGQTKLHDEDGNMSVAGSVSATQPQGKYGSGGSEAIGNGVQADLAFAFASGDVLLNLTDTDAPTFVDAGTYALTITVTVNAFTAGGYAVITLETAGSPLAVDTFDHPNGGTVTGIAKVAGAAALLVRVTNNDGVASRTFDLASANIVKLA